MACRWTRSTFTSSAPSTRWWISWAFALRCVAWRSRPSMPRPCPWAVAWSAPSMGPSLCPLRPPWPSWPRPVRRSSPRRRGASWSRPRGRRCLGTLAQFAQPAMKVHQVGYGFGTKEFEWPNLLRIWIGEPWQSVGPQPSRAEWPRPQDALREHPHAHAQPHDHHHPHHHPHGHRATVPDAEAGTRSEDAED